MFATGLRRKRKRKQDMVNLFRAEMNDSYKTAAANTATFDRATKEGERLVNEIYPNKQTTYAELPVFPYGKNHLPRWKSNLPTWVDQSSKSLEGNYLRSTPTRRELTNLYLQLKDQSLSIASLTLPTDEPTRPIKGLPVTPFSPPLIAPQPIEVDASPKKVEKVESNKNIKRAKMIARAAPPDSRISSKKPKETQKKEEPKPGKDTYHIIRTRSRSKIFLELLREDSSGYIVGWRLLTDLAHFDTAYWCFFNDFAYLEKHFPFMDIRTTRYTSRYGELRDIFFGRSVLDDIINALVHLYEDPLQQEQDTIETYFFILCMVFGEAPRFEEMQRFVFSSMNPQSNQKFGALRAALARDWHDTCDATYLLALVEFERIIQEDLGNKINCAAYKPLRDQFEMNRKTAHERCSTLAEKYKSIFHLVKDQHLGDHEVEDHLYNPRKNHLYGQGALNQLLNQEVHLLKHSELVKWIVLRRGRFLKKIEIEGLKSEPKTIGQRSIWEPDYMFWEYMKAFKKKIANLIAGSQMSYADGMDFLDNARPFLAEYGFAQSDPALYEHITLKCDHFENLMWKRILIAPGELLAQEQLEQMLEQLQLEQLQLEQLALEQLPQPQPQPQLKLKPKPKRQRKRQQPKPAEDDKPKPAEDDKRKPKPKPGEDDDDDDEEEEEQQQGVWSVELAAQSAWDHGESLVLQETVTLIYEFLREHQPEDVPPAAS